MHRERKGYTINFGRIWHSMSTSNISHGFWVLLWAALFACVGEVAVNTLRDAPSPVLLALGIESEQVEEAPAPKSDLIVEVPAQPEAVPPPAAESENPEIDHPLKAFFESLGRLKEKNGKVRVGYFGDSMIEGDLVTQSLRKDLQDRFGGTGVGFVPITSQTYGFRKSIWHRFSGDWRDYNLLNPQAPDHEYGISGEYFLTRRSRAEGRTWVKYKGADLYPSTETFKEIYLYYGRRKNHPEDISDQYVTAQLADNKDRYDLPESGLVNELAISTTPTDEVKLNFNIPNDLPVYGLSFESESGIFVDNFSSRGNSGMNLIEIPGETLNAFHEQLSYDLIVLQFGLNVISTKRKDFSHYEKGMERVVRHFQEHAPGASILLVGISDKSTRLRGKMQTDPSVPLILAAQERVAQRTGVGFLDLFQEMGGSNSMIQWVKDDLARKDYTHPTRRGAEKVGDIVRNYLLDGLQEYQDQKSGVQTFAERQ